MGVTKNSSQRKKVKNWESSFEEWFLMLPPLSKNSKEAIINIIPWITLILGILGLCITIKYSLLTLYYPFVLPAFAFLGGTGIIVSGILGLITYILLLASFPGTKKRVYQGWKLLFWSNVVSIISSILSISLLGILISLAAFYLLYQIKQYYK